MSGTRTPHGAPDSPSFEGHVAHIGPERQVGHTSGRGRVVKVLAVDDDVPEPETLDRVCFVGALENGHRRAGAGSVSPDPPMARADSAVGTRKQVPF